MRALHQFGSEYSSVIKKTLNYYKDCPARMRNLDLSPRNLEGKFDALEAGDGHDIGTLLGKGGMFIIPPHVFYSNKFIHGGNF